MKRFVLLLLLVALLACCGCGTAPAEKKGAKALPVLTVGMMPDTDSVPFVIAKEKGFFKAAGVEVELQQFKSAVDRDAAFQSGSIDGAVSDLLAVAFAKSGGFEVKVTSMTDGCYRLVAGKGLEATGVPTLAGKDVAVSRNTIIEYVTDRVLEANKMSPDSINKVVIPQIPVRLEMLQNGKIAAATLPEPMASIAVRNGCRLLTGSDQLGINPGVMVFSAKAVQEKRQALQAMYKAYNQAVEYLNKTDKKETMPLVIEKSGFPAAARDALVLPVYHQAALPAKGEVSSVMTWMQEKGLIKTAYQAEELFADIISK